MSRSRKQRPSGDGKIRNVRNFVSAYLASESGRAALNRRSIQIRQDDGKRKDVWRSSAMAHAFQEAVA